MLIHVSLSTTRLKTGQEVAACTAAFPQRCTSSMSLSVSRPTRCRIEMASPQWAASQRKVTSIRGFGKCFIYNSET